MGWYSNDSGVPSSPMRTMYFAPPRMLRGSTSLASAAITFGVAAPNPSRASTAPSVSLAANFFSTPACVSAASPSSSGGGANGILMAGGAAGAAGARTATGSGGGAKGILKAGGAGGGAPLPNPLPASRGEGT